MYYETVKTIHQVFVPSLFDLIDVDVFYSIYVEDASFDHDWAGGGVEKCSAAYIENTYWAFQYKGKTVMFDPGSGYASLLDEDSYFQFQLKCAEEEAEREAIERFETPDWDYI